VELNSLSNDLFFVVLSPSSTAKCSLNKNLVRAFKVDNASNLDVWAEFVPDVNVLLVAWEPIDKVDIRLLSLKRIEQEPYNNLGGDQLPLLYHIIDLICQLRATGNLLS
jgi:hypothetical protein